jgi:Ca-activated chloride channel family protein
MSHDPTGNPQLTAYALGELDGEEAKAMETLVAADDAAAKYVDDLRRMSASMTLDLVGHEDARLTAEQRAAIDRAAASSRSNRFAIGRAARWVGGIAALFVIGTGIGLVFLEGLRVDRSPPSRPPQGNVAVAVPPRNEPLGEPPADVAATTPTPAVAVAELKNSAVLNAKEMIEDSVVGRNFDELARADGSAGQSAAAGNPLTDPAAEIVKSPTDRSETAPAKFAEAATAPSARPSPLTKPTTPNAAYFAVPLGDKSRATRPASSPVAVAGAVNRESEQLGEPAKDSGVRLRIVEHNPLGRRPDGGSGEAYNHLVENTFLNVADQPLSTFSIDVDTASYANVRRFMTGGQLPPRDAVRLEELVNYFSYDYGAPAGDRPFATNIEVASCPWDAAHRLVRFGLQAKKVVAAERAAANLVFLIDVSGSMDEPNKLPWVKQSLRMLLGELRSDDRVAIVVYAGASGLALDSTSCDDRNRILDAIDTLTPGGSTNGSAGIQLAYEIAAKRFVKGGTNRVILATDGDFNVGVTSREELVSLIEAKRKSGVFLSVLGFGMGNLKDATMQQLADKGNGNYAYIDTLAEARKVLVEQAAGTLITVAKDVKVQVEFNPAVVASYRLIGYEKRLLNKEDFNDDTKDAGEIGAGHTVTALYEVVPVGAAVEADGGGDTAAQIAALQKRIVEIKGFLARSFLTKEAADALKREIAGLQAQVAELKSRPAAHPAVDSLKYQKRPAPPVAAPAAPGLFPAEMLTLKVRYKQPDGDVSTKFEVPVRDTGKAHAEATADFQFAAAVAEFALLLRDSPHKGGATFASVVELAQRGMGATREASPEFGYRSEFIGLVRKANDLLPGK